ncbi:MAG TPA: Pycsar system effector family protein [Chiayiivirga sp.]|nr:Pycsar system effector family protein [Chiayiivirga sp.]
MSPDSSTDDRPFSSVPERSAADHLLRLVQQHHVQLSMMADVKANIIITVSSIVLTLALGRSTTSEYHVAMVVLSVFTLIALLLAILAVLPKYRSGQGTLKVDKNAFNILFFGHFSSMSQDQFLRQLADAMQPARPYETVARDVYGQGCYLAKHKYPWLRWSYLFFLAGFVFACATQVILFILP